MDWEKLERSIIMGEQELTILTLLAGRWNTMEAYFWGLDIIKYPKKLINLLYVSNSDSRDFKDFFQQKLNKLIGYNSIRFVETDIVAPSKNAFIEQGKHLQEHSLAIAKMYNLAYSYLFTDWFLCLEDDVIAPSNTMELFKCYDDTTGYACGEYMGRHNEGLFIFDLKYKKTFGDDDACSERQWYGDELRNPYGKKEIGMGHLGLTLLNRNILEKLPKPIFKADSSLGCSGAILGCDIVPCLEIAHILKLKRICDFDIRGLHMDSCGKIH